jgi:HK97 family phage major capsid protein
MKTVAELKQKRAELLAEAQAFADIAKTDNRELNAEETTRVDAILGAENKAGEVAKLDADIARAEKLEQAKAKILAGANVTRPAEATPVVAGDFSNIVIPVRAHRVPESRKVFKGPDGDKNAYAFGQWFLGMMGNDASKVWAKEHGLEYRNAMSEGIDTKGGHIVPEQFEATIIDLRNDYGVARREFKVESMASDTKVVPRRTGGLTAYAVGEAATITSSDKTYDNVRLTAKKWGVIARYSSELNEDAVVTIATDLASEIAYAFANKEDECAFNGDGTSAFHGMVGLKNALAAGSGYTAATGNTAYSTLDIEDFLGMTAQLKSYAWKMGGPKWYIHRAGYSQSMERLALAAGGNTTANIAAGGQRTFLGYPVEFVEVMNSTLGAQTSVTGLAYFGNLKMGAIMGDRRGMALAQSTDVYFTTDELAIRGTERFDINVHDVGTATTADAGCIVVLKTPGS